MITLPETLEPVQAQAVELAPIPEPSESSRRMNEAMRHLNRWTTGPMLRAGLGPWLGTPIGGYLLLLRARGRRSGVVRETPLSYVIGEGSAWVMASLGVRTQWFRNLQADPQVEVLLPGRVVACRAAEERDPATRRRMLPVFIRGIGAPGRMGGVDPRTATDDEIVDAYDWVPLVRLVPVAGPLVAGPDDPGGSAWMWRQAVVAVLAVGLLRAAVGLARRVLG